MRMFRKKSETENMVTYEYLCEDYTLPYDGEVVITKNPLSAKLTKPATGEWKPDHAAFYAMKKASKLCYPDRFTHTAVQYLASFSCFRASYFAAIDAPNLSDAERQSLMRDALDRAKEAGVKLDLNETMRRILYGYEKDDR